ncbi:MAG: serine protease [Myxococcales bacterium]|nr:serine protease [Myxococcales bacterium]
MRLAVLLLALCASNDARPTHAALRKAFEQNRSSVVLVIGPHREGAGTVVGAGGHVLTSVEYVGLHEAQVRIFGVTLPAAVLAADARLGVSLLKVRPQDGGAVELRAVAVGEVEPQLGEVLVGIRRSPRGELSPVLGKVTRVTQASHVETDLPLPPGSPLFDARARLAGVSVKRLRGGCRVLPLARARALLESGAEAEP